MSPICVDPDQWCIRPWLQCLILEHVHHASLMNTVTELKKCMAFLYPRTNNIVRFAGVAGIRIAANERNFFFAASFYAVIHIIVWFVPIYFITCMIFGGLLVFVPFDYNQSHTNQVFLLVSAAIGSFFYYRLILDWNLISVILIVCIFSNYWLWLLQITKEHKNTWS